MPEPYDPWPHLRFQLAWESLNGVTQWQADEKVSVRIALRELHRLAGFGEMVTCELCREMKLPLE